jgi:DNA mismatch endonuclease, patch repair protein
MASALRRKSKAEIARNMSAIRSRENRVEKRLRSALHRLGLRFRKYSPDVRGKPDIVFRRARIAVFVDGDYWHGRMIREKGVSAAQDYFTRSQQRYWLSKLQATIARDDAVTTSLRGAGWMVLRYWESELDGREAEVAQAIRTLVKARALNVTHECGSS